MLKLIKYILLLFALAFMAHGINEPSLGMTPADTHRAILVHSISNQHSVESNTIPVLPEADLGSIGFNINQSVLPRLQRADLRSYFTDLRNVIQEISGRENLLTPHQKRFYNFSVLSHSRPISEYYVFALRQIII